VVWAGLVWLWRGANGAVVNTVMNLGVSKNVGNFLCRLVTGSLSRETCLH
jgi:hypothetical protein